MERNERDRRDRERYEGRVPERGERRWEHGEVGEGRTGPPDRHDYQSGPERRGPWETDIRGSYGERSEDWGRRGYGGPRTWSEAREPYRADERRGAWASDSDEPEPWAHTAPQWGGRGFERDEGYGPRSPTPTWGHESDRRWRDQQQTPRGAQFGYRVGQRNPGAREPEERRTLTGRGGRPPRDYRRADDRIRDEICELIVRETDIDASDVEIQVSAGEVTLQGTVDDRSCKRGLEDVVERVFGVTDVHNNLKVRKSAWREIGERLFGNGTENGSKEAETRTNPKT
jgi:hypothetical protein